MNTVTVGKHKVQLFDSIDELPIKRFHKFNKFMLIDSGIGSDLNDINAHIARIGKYLTSDPKSAAVELENLRQSLYLISQEINPKHLAFACMIYSLDGKIIEDTSDDNLHQLLGILSQAKTGWLHSLVDTLKKKIEHELALYFPSHFDDASLKEYYDRLKSRVLLQLDSLIRGTDNASKIEAVDDFLLTLAKPRLFSGKDSAEIEYNKQFEEMCLFLSKNLTVSIEGMSVLQFYNAFEYLKKLFKQSNKKGKALG